jgi:hypothetical protein
MVDWIANRDQERRWLEEAREYRLSQIKSPEDAIAFRIEFGARRTDHKKVYAVRPSEKKGDSK